MHEEKELTIRPQSTTEKPDRIWIENNDSDRYYKRPLKVSQGIEYARVSRHYFCSCGGALTAEEYITHFFELGHDHGINVKSPASTAPVVDEYFTDLPRERQSRS